MCRLLAASVRDVDAGSSHTAPTIMAQQNTFDVVSKVDLAEVKNAVNQAMKEVTQRYDFKDTNTDIELNEKQPPIGLATASEITLKSPTHMLQQKPTPRNVSL